MAKILVISPTPSHPQDAGNRARIFALLSGLKTAGHKIYFVFVKMEPGDEPAMAKAWDAYYSVAYRPPLIRRVKKVCVDWPKRLGIGMKLSYAVDDWYSSEITREIVQIKTHLVPDVVLVEYMFLSKVFDCFDKSTLKILDTHDVFTDRHILFHRKGLKPQWFYTNMQQEKKALDRADVVLAIQEKEAVMFKKITERNVITVGHVVPVSCMNNSTADSDNILFVGSDNHSNLDAIKWLIEKVLPVLRERLPGIKIDIVGSCGEKINPVEGLNIIGRVLDLAPFYRNARAVINPIRFGTGLKIKTIEALAYGKPLITTSVGADGFDISLNNLFVVADSPEEFADAIVKVYSTPQLRLLLEKNSLNYVKNYNEIALSPLASLIHSFCNKT